MSDEQRAKQVRAITQIEKHIDLVVEKYKLSPGVLHHLDDAWEAVRAAAVEVEVDWEQRRRAWEQGEGRSV